MHPSVPSRPPRTNDNDNNNNTNNTNDNKNNNRYGQDFDVRQERNPINIAYTNAGLDAHMDLPYYESPPGIQMLHCLENDQSVLVGGESLLMDVHHCAEVFRTEDPKAFRVLCEVPATFVKDHLERAHPAQMYCRRPHFEVDPESGDVSAVFWSPSFEGGWVGTRALPVSGCGCEPRWTRLHLWVLVLVCAWCGV